MLDCSLPEPQLRARQGEPWRPGRLIPLDAFVVGDAGEEDGALIAASIDASLAPEQPLKIIMHRAMVAAEPSGQGSQIDLDAVTAGRMAADHVKGFVRGDSVGNGLFGRGLRLEKSPHQGPYS